MIYMKLHSDDDILLKHLDRNRAKTKGVLMAFARVSINMFFEKQFFSLYNPGECFSLTETLVKY